ncbi:conserved hypothetical protein [Candidatus Protochlamydia naegleriophila]|uniref:Pyridoxamine 5'-phosphate oxidase N-terminal domain-containing protein n=1 Tax=Candidatus Protochlamydia naegleriophila TaxID=389348 RepID=A0A0U5JEC9_9BACT|nr:pyridoxamine 5'-phosphate oxidase family protein [Candidatus Protochlamydia naegleriophila]CUI16118.1 conserved hypothetical protein [Candidatus Protochlamydia naegleriophila]
MIHIDTCHPLEKMKAWIESEKAMGSDNPNRVVLATSSQDIPRSRIVAIREITGEGIVFFTQRETRKARDLSINPRVSMTLWLAQQQRQVVLEGYVKALTDEENLFYWRTIPREQQLRFTAYAPISSHAIPSPTTLSEKYRDLKSAFENRDIPMSDHYCGFHAIAISMCFYTLGSEEFSEVLHFEYCHGKWKQQLLSP